MTDPRVALLISPDEHGNALIDCAADNGRTAQQESAAYAAEILAALGAFERREQVSGPAGQRPANSSTVQTSTDPEEHQP